MPTGTHFAIIFHPSLQVAKTRLITHELWFLCDKTARTNFLRLGSLNGRFNSEQYSHFLGSRCDPIWRIVVKMKEKNISYQCINFKRNLSLLDPLEISSAISRTYLLMKWTVTLHNQLEFRYNRSTEFTWVRTCSLITLSVRLSE